jgi:hypothetical protein
MYKVFKKKKIPRGYVRIIGDNKSESIDSDTYGNIPYGLIESRVVLRVILDII